MINFRQWNVTKQKYLDCGSFDAIYDGEYIGTGAVNFKFD